jgi:hypothetical protein
VRAMVISAGTPGGASPAEVLRSSLACDVPPVARSACSRWCDAPLERCMGARAERALADARAQPVELSGPRCGVQEWSMLAATPVTVRDARRAACPGTGGSATITGHTGLSVGGGAPVQSQCSPAREHDSRHLTGEESWRGCGLRADLASASLERLQACEAHGVRCVIRLHEHGKPNGDDVARGPVTQACFPGTDLAALLADDILVRDGRTSDADGHGGTGNERVPVRLVGVHTPQGSGVFRTHLPPRIGPRQVAARSRGRGEVERSFRLDTSVNRLDALDAEHPCTLKALWHASRIASTIAALLAHTYHGHTQPQEAGTPRTEAPLHPPSPTRGLATGRLVSLHGPGLRADGGGSPAALGQDRGVAHAERERPQLAPTTIRPRSAPWLDTPAPCTQKGHQRRRQSSSCQGSSLRGHICSERFYDNGGMMSSMYSR